MFLKKQYTTTVFFILSTLLLGVLHSTSFILVKYGGWLELIIMSLYYIVLVRTKTIYKRYFRYTILFSFIFNLSNFISGIYWLYISMHKFGMVSIPLSIVLLVLFCCYLSIYPVLSSILWVYLTNQNIFSRVYKYKNIILYQWWINNSSSTTFAACWSAGELLRGTVFTGFPWLSVGYAYIDTPLAGFASWIGVYGIGFIAVWIATTIVTIYIHNYVKIYKLKILLTCILRNKDIYIDKKGFLKNWKIICFINMEQIIRISFILFFGIVANLPKFVSPVGELLSVCLLQGNILQNTKFSEIGIQYSIELYQKLLTTYPADLIVTPETAYPIFINQIPKQYIQKLQKFSNLTKSSLLIGAIGFNKNKKNQLVHYTNTMFGIIPNKNIIYRYDKRHLVPFGEFIFFGMHWLMNIMKIPLNEFTRGAAVQMPLYIKNHVISVNICYEDIFGEEITTTLLSHNIQAGLIVNTTNLAWFGKTIALYQHLQIARMRTLETKRPMVISTNTGITAAIDSDARIIAKLPEFTRGILCTQIQPTYGLTPYMIFGNTTIILIVSIILIYAFLRKNINYIHYISS